jgi:signal recognition particle subunit SRP54
MRSVTGAPIKFLGAGEKLDALEPFHPARVASRILDMGDVVSLVEKASETLDKEEAEKIPAKMETGTFDMKILTRQEAIIQSMTKQERAEPDVINGSRRKRIAAGAGVEVSEVNKLLKMHRQMADMMKKMGKGKMPTMPPGMGGGFPGGMPPGMFPGRR